MLMHVDRTLGQERHATLRVGRHVLRQGEKVVVLKLKVADVTVTFAGEIQTVGAVIVKREARARGAVKIGEATNGTGRNVVGVPERVLAIRKLAETGSNDTILVAQPGNLRCLGASVTRALLNDLLSANVPDSNGLVARNSSKERTIIVKCKTGN
jgi:hypothetical protein